MKYAMLGLIGVLAILAGVGYLGGIVSAGGETRLRAILTGTPLDPGAFGHADFDQRPDRVHFSVEANGVAQDEDVVTGTVRVITNAAPITELRGELSRKSGEDPGIIEVAEATWFKGTNLLVQLGRLDQTRFPGNESCETRVSVGPLDGSLVMSDDGMATLDIQSDVPDLIPGTGVDLRIRCEFPDEQGQRQRHETRWEGTLKAVAPASGVILEEAIEFLLDPLSGTGVGDLNLDSRLGDNVPVMSAEDTVEVWNGDAETSELILVGTLKQR